MERRPAQAVLPLVGLAADQTIRDRYNMFQGTKTGDENSSATASKSLTPPPYCTRRPVDLTICSRDLTCT
ncbi:MAG: hypothetical protein R6U98_32335, partial [Pirellulaceae bacterium]